MALRQQIEHPRPAPAEDSPPRPGRSRLARLARLAGWAASVGLVAWVARSAAHGVRFDEEDVAPLALSVPVACLSWALLGRAWASLVRAERPGRAVGTWARTQALGNLPGSLWAQAARAATVPGGPWARVATVAAESALTLAVGAALGGLLLAGDGGWRWALLAGLPLAALGAATLAGRRSPVPARAAVAACAWYLASWVAYCVAVVLVQLAVGPAPHPLAVAGAACVARAAGLAAVFAPRGIGVREWVYTALVAQFLPQDRAAAGAIGSRLVLVVAELVVLVAVGLPWAGRRLVPRAQRQ
ncbi:MAG TPA: hypothetical protein VKY15_07760 [Acidimicrobiales bacterium]|nr:hypothetical protein [Acidimicrobiales bacterium]